MKEISFIDTTLRDGQQSLWALNMKTAAMLGAAEAMDRIGFESLEFFVSIFIKKYIREHKENPWDWVREGVKRFHRTRLRNHGGLHGSGAMEKLPQAAMQLLAERLVHYGITLTRTSNCWNDFAELRGEVIDLRRIGMDTVVNLIFQRFAAPHRRILRAESARSSGHRSLSHLFQRCRRSVDAGAGAYLDPGDHAKCRRSSGRVSRPLQQWAGAALLHRSDPARHHLVAYRDPALGQRLVATVGA